MRDLARRATFIFHARVVALGASEVDVIPASERTVVVEVNRLFKRPPSTGDGSDFKRVTVQVNNPKAFQLGQEVVFFATGWTMSESIALLELGHYEGVYVERDTTGKRSGAGDPDTSAFLHMFDSVATELEERALCDEFGAVALVALARVLRTRPIPDTLPPIARSEHSPRWSESVLRPLRVFKRDTLRADSASRDVTVLSSRTRSYQWREYPRIPADSVLLFMLHSVAASGDAPHFRGIDRRAEYIVFDTLDLHEAADTSLLSKCLRR
jgi:hypothetical protein